MRRVAIESPWRGDTPEEGDRNARYLEACIADCIRRHESPYASHKMLTTVLDDMNEDERATGISAGFFWSEAAEARVFYVDLGISEGMKLAVKHAAGIKQITEYRVLGGEWKKK